ncbi:uncharacterized protein LOC136086829 [Hydra vulgaris]|uniref:Uncharacterized protein LOC136086829 n=1 Tax=Hydra vulgaris TaxID=6087 RepID=A0ABM4CTY0_HYDVU
MDRNIIEYNSIKPKSCIPLDKNLATKKAITNIKNEDNEWYISVNVFGYENSSVHILRVSINNNRKYLKDFLLILSSVTNHFCFIKSLSRLLSSQTSKKRCTIHYCRNCLFGFNTHESLFNHKLYCDTHNSVRIELPKPNSTMQFNNHNRSMRVPFVVYAGFESFIKPRNTYTPYLNDSYTKQYQRHIPSSFCCYIKCFDKSIYESSLVTFTASNETDDVAQKFVDSFEEDIRKIFDTIKFSKKFQKTLENEYDFNAAILCYICEEDLEKDKVRDHCHITGKYRGTAHKDCNLNYKIPKFFPYIFHNLSGYDCHLFIKKLSGGKLSCIPNNEEKYISFSREIKAGEFIYKDDSLSKNLTKDQCRDTGKLYSGKKLDLLLRKGVYPYNWVDSINTFTETQLSPKESGYHDLYNVSDGMLLTDVFENFRDYIDANNLYGWAISKPLPTHGFKWMDENELTNWKSIFCKLEVDLNYPENLHDNHNDYPLATERITVHKVEKLVPNLNNKKNYIVHYKYLKLYERLGLKVTNIHKGRGSLAYEIKTEDYYADIFNDVESKFYTSEFDPKHSATNNVSFKFGANKKVIGMFKDESAGALVEEFIKLRSKLYSYKVHEKDNKKCKRE